MLSNVRFAAVLGGTVNATGAPGFQVTPGSRGYQAIGITGGSNNIVSGVRLVANYSDAAIMIYMSKFSEVSHCDIGGAEGSLSEGRCMWTLST